MTFTKLPLVLAAASLTFVAACEGTNPNGNQNANQGAMIGAGLGALTGIIAGDTAAERRRGAVLGAAIGAGAGAVVGNRLDLQEEELRRSLPGNVQIVNNGQNLVVTMPEGILFSTDSATVSGSAQNNLYTVAGSINSYPNTTVNVIGHTDNVGDSNYNFNLSQRRAQAVASVLINAGVSPARIRSIGRGENAPVATNETALGRQQNRRVEIVITPN